MVRVHEAPWLQLIEIPVDEEIAAAIGTDESR